MKLAHVCILAIGCHHGVRGWTSGSDSFAIPPPKHEIELASRRLSPAEAALVDKNGFAILRGDITSFHVGYTALFHAHQPVYVTADSLLYAWHQSYDKILEHVERQHLIPAVTAFVAELRRGLAASSAPAEARADLDVYLAVAASLLEEKPVAPVAGGDPALIAELVKAAKGAIGDSLVAFGQRARFDFTMMKPRGHYEYSFELQRYFRAMTWLGRVEIRLATKSERETWSVDRRVVRGAALLGSLFTDTARASWKIVDDALTAFVGSQDSMSLPAFATAAASLGDVDRASDASVVAAFEPLAVTKIRTQLVKKGQGAIAVIPFGQRFVPDAQVLSDLVYPVVDSRLMPSALDVGYAVLGNPVARDLLAPEIAKYGVSYEAGLATAAARTRPTASIYQLWIEALHGLSPDGAALPAPLASKPWSKRMLNAQLASWAELRHDNLLYSPQSFTAELSCEYPAGYVDPYPAFYTAMEQLAHAGRAALDATTHDARLVAFFDHMAQTMARLRVMAERERTNQPLDAGDLDFLNHMVSLNGRSGGCTTVIEPQGWYAELFFDRSDALFNLPVVADVHTQPTDEAGNPVGLVLHVGTGKPAMMAVTIKHDAGAHTQTYRGIVSSYRELITKNFERLTDTEWRDRTVAPPAWLTEIMAP